MRSTSRRAPAAALALALVETKRALQNIFKDGVIQRDGANYRKARVDALQPELERMKQHVLLLRVSLTAFATALGHPQHKAINDVPPEKIADANFKDLKAMMRNFDGRMPPRFTSSSILSNVRYRMNSTSRRAPAASPPRPAAAPHSRHPERACLP